MSGVGSRPILVRGQPRHLHSTALAGNSRLGRRRASASRKRIALGRRPQLLPRHRSAAFRNAERARAAFRADDQHSAVLHRAICARRGASHRPRRHPPVGPRKRGAAAKLRRAGGLSNSRRPCPHRERRLGGGLRWRPQHRTRAAGPATRRHTVRGTLRDRGHRAGHPARSRAPGLVRSLLPIPARRFSCTVNPTMSGASITRSPSTKMRHRSSQSGKRPAARAGAPGYDRRDSRRGDPCGFRFTTPSA